MKRKRSIGKAILSFCLAIMLVLQTVAFSAAAFADGESGQPVTESSSVSETVNELPGESPGESSTEQPSATPGAVDDTLNEPSTEEPPATPEVADDTPNEPSIDQPSSSPEAVDDAQPAPTVEKMAADPADKTTVLANANPAFTLTVKQGDPAVVVPAGARLTAGRTLPLRWRISPCQPRATISMLRLKA